jgi:hypothetical protein
MLYTFFGVGNLDVDILTVGNFGRRHKSAVSEETKLSLAPPLKAGWPEEILKKSPKKFPNPFFAKISTRLISRKKVAKIFEQLMWLKKTNQSKQSPQKRKFAQSGHPVSKQVPLRLARGQGVKTLGLLPQVKFGVDKTAGDDPLESEVLNAPVWW